MKSAFAAFIIVVTMLLGGVSDVSAQKQRGGACPEGKITCSSGARNTEIYPVPA
jgi:hypothetical protein